MLSAARLPQVRAEASNCRRMFGEQTFAQLRTGLRNELTHSRQERRCLCLLACWEECEWRTVSSRSARASLHAALSTATFYPTVHTRFLSVNSRSPQCPGWTFLSERVKRSGKPFNRVCCACNCSFCANCPDKIMGPVSVRLLSPKRGGVEAYFVTGPIWNF